MLRPMLSAFSIHPDGYSFQPSRLHIEAEGPDVILATGAPAETLEGNADRADFDNFDEYGALYGPS